MLTWFENMRCLLVGAILFLVPQLAFPQDNYEIQVYGSETVAPGHTMVELHSNFTVSGSKTNQDGVYATEHAWHETLEITQGITDWFETGFYIFTSATTRRRMAVGRRPYPPARARSRKSGIGRSA